jgi:hypothetical protein
LIRVFQHVHQNSAVAEGESAPVLLKIHVKEYKKWKAKLHLFSNSELDGDK